MAITLAFLQIFGKECVAMVLEKNFDSFGAKVLQEFHTDVVVTWGCRWFRLLQSS